MNQAITPRPIIRRIATLGLILAWGCLVGTPSLASGKSLERGMRELAEGTVAYLTDSQVAPHTIAVVKFQIRKDDRMGLSVGPLNQGLADRLERAILLALADRNGDPPFRLVCNASSVIATISGASHLTPEGRQAILDGQGEYIPYWGEAPATPDLFITGVAEFSDDLTTLSVSLNYFTRSNLQRLQPLGEAITVETDLDILADSGESFTLRGNPTAQGTFQVDPTPTADAASPQPVAVAASALQAREQVESRPELTNPPVELQIRYNERIQPFRYEEIMGQTQAFVPTPRENQQVTLVLIRRDPTPNVRYGVVLKVNGLNTIDKEQRPVTRCRHWVLEPDAKPIRITGFLLQQSDGSFITEAFKVSSDLDSILHHANYGPEVGQISFAIFREDQGRPPQGDSPSEQLELMEDYLVTGPPPIKAPVRSFADLRTILDDQREKRRSNRGLIEGSGLFSPSQAEVVPFYNPGLVDQLVIGYFSGVGQ